MNEIDSKGKSLHLFMVYARKDEKWKVRLEDSMISLVRQNIIKITSDTEILPGEEWAKAIDGKIMQADIILLLISSNFLSSTYCFEYEMKKALKLHEEGVALTIPVIISPCYWNDEPFAKLQFIPKSGEPLRKENDIKTEYAFLEAAKELTVLIKGVYSENINRVETFKRYFRDVLSNQKEVEDKISLLKDQKQSIQRELEMAEGKIRLIKDFEEKIKLEEEKNKRQEQQIKQYISMDEDKGTKIAGLYRKITSLENEKVEDHKLIQIKNSLLSVLLFLCSISIIGQYISIAGIQTGETFGFLILATSLYFFYVYSQDLAFCISGLVSKAEEKIQENWPIVVNLIKKIKEEINNIKFKN